MATVAEILTQALQNHQAGNLVQAEQLYRQILQAEPDHADTLHLQGVLAYQRGQFDVAVASIRHALKLNPKAAAYYSNLGLAQLASGQPEEAIAEFQEALRLQPEFPQANNNLGNALFGLKRFEEALNYYRAALRLQPNYVDAQYNLGNCLKELGKLDDAVLSYQKAILLNPHNAEMHGSLALAYTQLGRWDDALACCEVSLRLNPQLAEAHFNRSLLWLLTDNWHQGWPEYEWRLRMSACPLRAFRQPRWDGSALNGRSILIHAEQGLGDTLQFIRFLPEVKARGGGVFFECQPALKKLLANVAGTDELYSAGSPLPQFDFHLPLLSLPGVLGTNLETIPNAVPYLHADPELVDLWRLKLESYRDSNSNLLIGIAWQGNPDHPADRKRSIPTRYFKRLVEIAGVRLVRLQKLESGKGQDAGFGMIEFGEELDNEHGPFMDSAAIMKCLDLVISSDTSIPHLAGALAVPVWIALPFSPDWRWRLQSNHSPWYPTMHIFRQTSYGDWDAVFERMARKLQSVLANRAS